MSGKGFSNIYWGFLFIMVDLRIQGFDILPDTIGYILFAIGLGMLIPASDYFSKARTFNFPMIILSVFTIYESPVHGGGVQFSINPFAMLLAVASIILSLFIVYNLFLGIKDMAEQLNQMDIQAVAEQRWKQYLWLQVATFFAFIIVFIPFVAVIYILALFVASIMLLVMIMTFLKRCEETLGNQKA